MPDFDNAWKEALDLLFEPFMAFFFPEAHREIDWSRKPEMLDTELQKITPESDNRKVASFAILGDNRSAWRPTQFGYELWGTKVGIEFATAKLLDYAADEGTFEANPNRSPWWCWHI